MLTLPIAPTRRITIPRPHGAAKRWGQPATVMVEHAVEVREVIRETADAVTLVLAATNGRALLFKAGQYLTHCFDIDGERVKRAYSISSAEGGALACTIKAVEGGKASGFALQGIAPGYRYTAMGPSGDFVLPQDTTAPLAFLAAGSGITPVIAMVETALLQNPMRDVCLLYASRNATAEIFGPRLQSLAARYPSLRYVPVYSRPAKGYQGEKGRLDGARAATLMAVSPAHHAYLCGPVTLMDEVAAALQGAGLPATQVHRERFFAAPKSSQTRPTTSIAVECRKSQKTITQRPGETLLEAGLREGVALNFSCTVGGCAACKLKVLDGPVGLDEPNCLSAEERAAGYTLSCSAYALGPVSIDA